LFTDILKKLAAFIVNVIEEEVVCRIGCVIQGQNGIDGSCGEPTGKEVL